MDRENFNKENIKKYITTIITILLILLIAFIVVCGVKYCGTKYNNSQNNNISIDNEKINYEILDSNIFNNGEMRDWIDINIIEQGLYFKNYEDYTYILMSGGFKTTTGYGIALESVKGSKSNICVSYSIISPQNNVAERDCYPNMIIRVPLDERKIEADFIEESQLNLVENIDNIIGVNEENNN